MYFHSLNSAVNVKLTKAYYFSLYGCELWHLENSHIQAIYVAFPK